MDNVIFQPV